MSETPYAWDKTGSVDKELEHWENELARFRFQPARSGDKKRRWMVVAAVMLLAVGIAWNVYRARISALSEIAGDVSLNGAPAQAGQKLRPGDRLVTQAKAGATIRLGVQGSILVSERSALTLVKDSGRRRTIRIDYGAIQVSVSAPPYAFTVETAASVAHDMGCGYEITTNAEGVGSLRVTEGWVRLLSQGVESLVIEGSEAELRTPSGPGVPITRNAPRSIRVLADRMTSGIAVTDFLLDSALAEAQTSDAITLLNLLWRAPEHERSLIYRRLAELKAPPQGVSWDRFRKKDWTAVADWWPHLGFRESVKLPTQFYAN